MMNDRSWLLWASSPHAGRFPRTAGARTSRFPSLPDVPPRARDAGRRHPEVRRRVPGVFGVRR